MGWGLAGLLHALKCEMARVRCLWEGIAQEGAGMICAWAQQRL